MIFSKMKRHAGIVLGGVLLVVLALFIVENLTVPVYGLPGGPLVVCGTGTCLCICEAREVEPPFILACDCQIVTNVGCFCWCQGGTSDECEMH